MVVTTRRSKEVSSLDAIATPFPAIELPIVGTINVDTNTFTPKMGAELLAEAIAEPSMDRYLDRAPKLLTEKDWTEFVQVLQRKRALFITAEQKRKEPKTEGETTDE